jgi:transposase
MVVSVLWYWETKSFIQVQRRYRQEYGEQAPGRQSIKRWLEQFQETGSVLHKKGAGRPSVDADTVEMIREQYKLSGYASVICSPSGDTPSAKRFLPTRWRPSTLEPYSERISE